MKNPIKKGIIAAVILMAGLMATAALIENSGDTAPLALLAESVSYADGQVFFTIPESSSTWSIWINGRVEAEDIGGMSVHYLENESADNSWESGKTYSFDVSNGGYTELQLEAEIEGDGIAVDIVEILPEQLKVK